MAHSKYDFIFIVLVYKNTEDLREFFEHFHIANSKVIVVNSYFDESTENTFREIASKNNADFISVPNKGYGYGNNRGCEFAISHYNFKYLIISNADIIIKHLDINDIKSGCINAPVIKTLNGKYQNPFMVSNIGWSNKIKYRLFKKRKYYGILAFCAITRLQRELFLLLNRHKCKRVFAAHGAFVILPYTFLIDNYPIYNESMFLFCEEEHLARLAETKSIKTYFNPKISVLHKEDGSVGELNTKAIDITSASYITLFEYWNK